MHFLDADFWQIVNFEFEQNSGGDWWETEYARTEQLRKTAFAFWPAHIYIVYGIEPVGGSFKHREKEDGKSPFDDNCLLLWPNQMHPLKAAAA